MNDVFAFNQWLENKWRNVPASNPPSELDIAFSKYLEEEKTYAFNKIMNFFAERPKIVVNLTKEVFFSLPRNGDNWPQIDGVKEWLETNTAGKWYMYDQTTYIFALEEDALAFRLRWT